jgi:NAD-dependent dihydropyrimidine dehydrogenase PreA subunit
MAPAADMPSRTSFNEEPIMESSDTYVKLCERLNRNAAKLPPLASVLALLREVFTPEQAALVAEMPLGANTIKALAALLQRDAARLEEMLEAMADEGTIFVTAAETGEKAYAVMPFAPGIFEMQFLKGEEDEKTRKRAKLMADMHEELNALSAELYKDMEAANKRLGAPALRTLAVEEELPGGGEIATWERISDIISREESFAVGTCMCRQQAKFRGHPCTIPGVPLEACVYFGKAADYIVDRNFGRRLSREGLLDFLKTCADYGLVHNINNFLGNNIVLCNCCGCCCEILTVMIKHRGLKRVVGSNFLAVVDGESCTGCGECVDHCQMHAMEMRDGTVAIDPDCCLGCGNCVARCPAQSLSLVRCAEYKPRNQRDTVIGFGV